MKKVLFIITFILGIFLSSPAQNITFNTDSVQKVRVEFDKITVNEQRPGITQALNNQAQAIVYIADALVVNANSNTMVAEALTNFSKSKVEKFQETYNIENEVWQAMIKREVTIRSVLILSVIISIIIIAIWMYKHRDRESHWQNILIRGSTAIAIVIVLYFFLEPALSNVFNSQYHYYKELLTTF